MHNVIIFNDKKYPNGITISLDSIDIQGGEHIVNTSNNLNGDIIKWENVTPIIVKFIFTQDSNNLQIFAKLTGEIKGKIDKLISPEKEEILEKGTFLGYFNGTYEFRFQTRNNLA